jgi:hypothetical protein
MRQPTRDDIVTNHESLDQLAAAEFLLNKNRDELFYEFSNTLAALHIYFLEGYAFYFYLECYLQYLDTDLSAELYINGCEIIISICILREHEIRSEPKLKEKVLGHLMRSSTLGSKIIGRELVRLNRCTSFNIPLQSSRLSHSQ